MGHWIAETGVPEWQVYAHQTPALAPTLIGDSLRTAEMFDQTTAGVTGLPCTMRMHEKETSSIVATR